MNKRGLSDIVTAVLIILMVIAAVTVVWLAIQRGILGKLDNTGAECVTLDVSAVSCTNVYNETGSIYKNSTVLVKRGADDVNLQNATVLVEFATGEAVTVTSTSVAAGESKIVNILASDTSDKAPTKVSVGGIVMYSSGKTGACAPSTAKVACA